MFIGASGLALIRKSEGFRSRVYPDIAGFRTIGFGHRLQPDESFPNGISADQGERLLDGDVEVAEAAVARLVKAPLTQGQFDALVDFVFNLGAGRLQSSTLLMYLNQRLYDRAAAELLKWDHSGAKEIAALKTRREAEFELWTGKKVAA